MSHYDYEKSKAIYARDEPFYALIMAAIRKADSDNLLRLQKAFWSIFEELQERYNLPGGYYPGEPHDEELTPASNDDTPPF